MKKEKIRLTTTEPFSKWFQRILKIEAVISANRIKSVLRTLKNDN